MRWILVAIVLAGMCLALPACSSSSSSANEPKKLEGDRFPKGLGPKSDKN
jgi:hypothetical protein